MANGATFSLPVINSFDLVKNSNISFSSRVLNFVEPDNINGVFKTKIYTEINTNLKIGDKVFIVNGNYDTNTLIKVTPFQKGATGYTILNIINCAITLDIDYTGLLPNNTDLYDNYIKIFTVSTQQEFDYYNEFYTNDSSAAISLIAITNRFGNFKNNILYVSATVSQGTYSVYGFNKVSTTHNLTAGFLWTNINAQFDTNTITNLNTNNGILYVVNNSFTYNNSIFNSNHYYKYDTLTNKWVQDITYDSAYLSKTNFRNGNFIGGNFNDGIFGSYDKQLSWSGSQSNWNNGVLLNSNWDNGSLGSKSDAYKFQSYYTTLVNGSPKQSTDFSNNNGYGYNSIIDSNILTANIYNGVFENSNIGISSTYSVFDEFYSGTNSTYTNVYTNKGLYKNSVINNTKLNNSKLYNSNLYNSFLNSTNVSNSNLKKALYLSGSYDVDASIKILDYDVVYSIVDGGTSLSIGTPVVLKTYKFYIADSDYLKLEFGDRFYFKNLLSPDLQDIITVFDDYFIVDNYSKDITGFTFSSKGVYDIRVQVKSKIENSYNTSVAITHVAGLNTWLVNGVTSVNTKQFASVDVSFSILDSSGNTTTSTLLNYYNNDNSLKANTFDISNAFIVNGDFDSGLFKGTWKNGHASTPNDFLIKRSLGVLIGLNLVGNFGNYNLEVDYQINASASTWQYFQPSVGDILYFDGIEYFEPIFNNEYSLNGQYIVNSVNVTSATHSIILEDYYQNILNQGFTAGGSFFHTNHDISDQNGSSTSLTNPIKFENATINGGVLHRQYFNNSTLTNVNMNTSNITLNKSNTFQLLINRSYFDDLNNNMFNGCYLFNSFIINNQVDNAIIHRSLFSGTGTFSNGLVAQASWYEGTFNGGLFYDSKYDSTAFDTSFTITNSFSPFFYMWNTGIFNGGSFVNSMWYDTSTSGTFSGGNFYNSIMVSGNITGGLFGNNTTPTANTVIQTGNIYGGNFNNATIGFTSSNAFQIINFYNGTVNNAVIIGSPLHQTINWYGGIFNKGEFGNYGLAKWYDGLFNNGIFNSTYGDGINTYSWNGGTFSNGLFNTQSSWAKGSFIGGVFNGTVWNDGIFTNGKFIGSGTASSNNIVFTNPQAYINSFTASPNSNSFYGLWRNGSVVDNVSKINLSPMAFSNIFDTSTNAAKQRALEHPLFQNMVWLNGTFSHALAVMQNSMWLDGDFGDGTFQLGAFNPYVTRPIIAGSASWSATQSYQLYDSCIWNGGTFQDGTFNISSWNNGIIQNGTFSSIEFNKGTVNYASFYNSIWTNGRWRNGNWYGSDFKVYYSTTASNNLINPNTGIVTTGDYHDQLVKQMIRLGTSSTFIWNAFTNSNAAHGYSDFNNTQITLSNIPSSSFTYSMVLNIPNYTSMTWSSTFSNANTSLVYTKLGNGQFQEGVWESGVWNNGDRRVSSNNLVVMDDVLSFSNLGDDSWSITLTGNTFSNVNTGDQVSIGNLVMIDVNENRKFIKDKLTILNQIDPIAGSNIITVSYTTTFPIKRIQRDSTYHKIYVTNNVWLNGAFLNGIFSGVWNNGIIKGSPKISEMYSTQWIDGTFDGGHFNSTKVSLAGTYSTATYSTSVIQNMTFKDNAVAIAPDNFRYFSWMDLNYENYSLSTVVDSDYWNYEDSVGSVFKNAVGLISNDVLSSQAFLLKNLTEATFNLNLGTKYKRYTNFVGSDGIFQSLNTGLSTNYKGLNFYDLDLLAAATISPPSHNSIQISGNTLAIKNTSPSNYGLSIEPTELYSIPNNRYVIVEFGLTATPITGTVGIVGIGPYTTTPNAFGFAPVLNENITSLSIKQEFFYNPLIPSYNNKFYINVQNFTNPASAFTFLAITEIDMMPFYQYYYLSEISLNISEPYVATAPFIDYSNNNYSFIDNIVFSFDTSATFNSTIQFIPPAPNRF
jgi:hypothetical protein